MNNCDCKRILVVEDSVSARKLLEYNLKKEGYIVKSATNGKEALELLEYEEVDLIISDYMMPEMNGIEFKKVLYKDSRYSKIPFVFLSAKAQITERETGMQVGAIEYMTKPYDPVEIVEKIKTLLTAFCEEED